ncbi:MAG: M20/M25/M40 family metallo-hydrolase [Planctomycetes bacterium]|nr:M20/M25/M40 family metallo-hydrolase [Planctomycetota bacterium]
MLRTRICALVLSACALGWAQDEPYLEGITALTSDQDYVKAGEAYFSPDGTRILYQGIQGAQPYFQIYVMNADGSGQRMVSTGKGKTTCAFFDPRDANRFVYASSHLDPRTHEAPKTKPQGRSYAWDYEGSMDVFLADLRSGEILERLTTADGYDAECSFSSDGKLICYTSRLKGDSDIWLMNSDGSDKRVLVRKDGTDGGPFFMPGDEWVLYRASRGDDQQMQVYLTRVDGSETRQLTNTPRVNWAPFSHPSGDVVALSSSLEGHTNYDVVLVKTDGSRREYRLTTALGFDGLPVFSPDGEWIMWTSTRAGGKSQIYKARFRMPPDELFVVPTDDLGDPSAPANPHAANPHAANPHTTNPHAANPPSLKGVIGPRIAAPGIERIRAESLSADVAWLADDAREGREAVSRGGRSAAAYVARRFAEAGLEPGAANGTYWQPFEVSLGASVAKEGNVLAVGDTPLALGPDWRPLLYSGSATVRGELVFCGYGISASEHDYDDLAGADLQGKVAVVLTGGPRQGKGGAFGGEHPSVHEDLRLKVGTCRDAGAAAVVLVQRDEAHWISLDGGDPGVPVLQLARTAAASALGLDPAAEAAKLERGPATRALGKRAHVSTRLERRKGKTQNVIGRLPGRGTSDEVVVIGAHYDHLGFGGTGSLASEARAIHNGADDNASGTAALFALAEAFAAAPPEHEVWFVAFGAEEKGLLGSQHLVEQLGAELHRVRAMINMDMIGDLRDKPLVVGGAGTSPAWPALLQAAADVAQVRLQPQLDGQGPSDHASFYRKDVPVLFLFTGNHERYHKPTDDFETVDLVGAERAARVAYVLARGIDALPERPAFSRVESSDQPRRMVSTGQKSAYFGSIPEYAAEDVEGVLLSGAKAGTPAEACGIQAGDVVVEFAGKTVKNIYDYVNALRLCKAGQTITVVVQRGGQRVSLEATLGGK